MPRGQYDRAASRARREAAPQPSETAMPQPVPRTPEPNTTPQFFRPYQKFRRSGNRYEVVDANYAVVEANCDAEMADRLVGDDGHGR